MLKERPCKKEDSETKYRPIYLLDADVMGKVFEKLTKERLVTEIEGRGGGLNLQQYGFTRGRLTVDSIQKVLEIARRRGGEAGGRH